MNSLRVDPPFEVDRLNSAADFLPAWDVPAAGKEVSDALQVDIETIRKAPAPNPVRKIRVILGASGHGKTHLLGRVLNLQRERIHFVYAPMVVVYPSEPARPIQWCLVESLFDAGKQPISPLARWLAALLQPSFITFIDQLPTGTRSRLSVVRQQLEHDPLAALLIFATVDDLGPYHQLADSLLERLPTLPATVVRALVLGLSPAADAARKWLRGEAEQVPEERLRELKLPLVAPDSTDVLKGVAGILQRVHVPLLLCVDQTERLLQHSDKVFRDLTGALMAWLQEVPNLELVLGCIEEHWKLNQQHAGYQAFLGRCQLHQLLHLTTDQTVALLLRRLASWGERPRDVPVGWPFDLESVRRLAEKTPVQPRAFISVCRERFMAWDAEGRKGLISLDVLVPVRTIEELFMEDWDRRLVATKSSRKEAIDYPEEDLWQGVGEALAVAQHGAGLPSGVRLEKIIPQAIKSAPKDSRPSAQLDLIVGKERRSLVIAVSKKDSGTAFASWYRALEAATGKSVVGAVVVWPQRELSVGKTAEAFKHYSVQLAKGVLRPFPLDENSTAFDHLVCLRQLIEDANNKNVTAGTETLTPVQCRELAAKTGILANLKLFEILFHNWPALDKLRPQPAASEATALAATSVAVSVPAAIPGLPATTATKPTAATAPAIAPSAQSTAVAISAPRPISTNSAQWADERLKLVVEKLRNRGQGVTPDGYEIGPTFVRLRVKQGDDADFSKIKRQAENLKLQLALERAPLIASQAGYISIDVQRPDRQPVALEPLLKRRPANLDGQPAFPLGVDVGGQTHWLNLADPGTCHLLVTGTTGSGKSEFLKALLAGLAARLGPDALQFLLVDPKQVTFNLKGGSPYLPEPVVFDAAEALPLIQRCCGEMERRYALLRAQGREHVGQLEGRDAVPRWVVIFDEFADLMSDRVAKKELEGHLRRLGGMARAAGIHLVLGTQRAEASVVTPLLRSNLPGRVSLQVPTERDSKLILDEPDAAFLLGKGDLFLKRGGGLLRLQSPLVSKHELETILRCH